MSIADCDTWRLCGCYNETMRKLFAFLRHRPAVTIAVIFVVMCISAYILDIVVWQSPQRVFWGALQADMGLSGVDCTVSKQSGGSSSQQSIWLDLAGKQNTLVTTTLSQNGSTVTTEDINTKVADFIRYVSVTTSAKDKSGKRPDTSKIINVWAKQPRTPDSQPMLGKVALGGCIVPLVDISKGQQAKLMAGLTKDNVFWTNFAASKWHWRSLAPYREYTVKVDPAGYIPFMKQADAVYGTKALSSVQAASYLNQPSAQLVFRIGAQSHRIQKISYIGRQQSFSFSHYGERPDTTAPNQTISIGELQKRLQALR